jgi:hypothetical protein
MTNAFNSGHVTYPAVMQRCNQQSLYCIVVALHGRSCLTWYIYIDVICYKFYIYMYVENTWKIYECRWTCDICSSAVFSHTFALGLGMFYFEA